MIYSYQAAESIARDITELRLPAILADRQDWSAPVRRAATNNRASTEAGNTVGNPNRASDSGWVGTRSIGPMMSSASMSNFADGVANSLRQRDPSPPNPAAVASTERCSNPGVTVIEGVSAVDFRPAPRQPVATQVEAAQEARTDGHRMKRRAMIVQQSGQDRFAAAGAAAHLSCGLEHGDFQTCPGQHDGGGEPVGPAADHGRGAHTIAS